jgi:hypothetical protein
MFTSRMFESINGMMLDMLAAIIRTTQKHCLRRGEKVPVTK